MFSLVERIIIDFVFFQLVLSQQLYSQLYIYPTKNRNEEVHKFRQYRFSCRSGGENKDSRGS